LICSRRGGGENFVLLFLTCTNLLRLEEVDVSRNLRGLIELAVLFTVAPLSGLATDYCVDARVGDDRDLGTCTPYRPWASIGRVNRGNYQGGDSILFRAGQSFHGALYLDNNNSHGTPGRPIVLGSYPFGLVNSDACRRRPLDDDRRARMCGATILGDNAAFANSGLIVSNAAGLDVRDLNFVGTQLTPSYSSYGLLFSSDGGTRLKHISIDHVTVSGFSEGILLTNAPFKIEDGHQFFKGTNSFSDVGMSYVASHDNGDAGVYVIGYICPPQSGCSPVGFTRASDIYVGRCLVYNNKGTGETAVATGWGILWTAVDRGMIEHNVVHDNGGNNPTPSVSTAGIIAATSDRIVIQYNESYRQHVNPASGTDADGFNLSASNSIAQYNYSHDNDGAAFLVDGNDVIHAHEHDNIIRYNISENDGRQNGQGVFFLTGNGFPVRNFVFYNNTIYTTDPGLTGTVGPGVFLGDSATNLKGMRFYNNIFMSANGVPPIVATDPQIDVRFQGNNYWVVDGPFATSWLAGGSFPWVESDNFNIVWGADSQGQGLVYTSVEDWRDATGQETLHGHSVALNRDPGLCSPGYGGTMFPNPLTGLTAYKLAPGSPMIDAALNLRLLFGINPGSRDFYGDPIPGPEFDVGADEFQPDQTCDTSERNGRNRALSP